MSATSAAVLGRNVATGRVPRSGVLRSVSRTMVEDIKTHQQQHRHDTATVTHPPLSRKIQINRIAFAILLLTARDCLKQIEEVCNITIKKYQPSLSDDYVYLAVQGNSDGEDCRFEDGLEKLSGAAKLSDRCLNQGCQYLNQLFLFPRN